MNLIYVKIKKYINILVKNRIIISIIAYFGKNVAILGLVLGQCNMLRNLHKLYNYCAIYTFFSKNNIKKSAFMCVILNYIISTKNIMFLSAETLHKKLFSLGIPSTLAFKNLLVGKCTENTLLRNKRYLPEQKDHYVLCHQSNVSTARLSTYVKEKVLLNKGKIDLEKIDHHLFTFMNILAQTQFENDTKIAYVLKEKVYSEHTLPACFATNVSFFEKAYRDITAQTNFNKNEMDFAMQLLNSDSLSVQRTVAYILTSAPVSNPLYMVDNSLRYTTFNRTLFVPYMEENYVNFQKNALEIFPTLLLNGKRQPQYAHVMSLDVPSTTVNNTYWHYLAKDEQSTKLTQELTNLNAPFDQLPSRLENIEQTFYKQREASMQFDIFSYVRANLFTHRHSLLFDSSCGTENTIDKKSAVDVIQLSLVHGVPNIKTRLNFYSSKIQNNTEFADVLPNAHKAVLSSCKVLVTSPWEKESDYAVYLHYIIDSVETINYFCSTLRSNIFDFFYSLFVHRTTSKPVTNFDERLMFDPFYVFFQTFPEITLDFFFLSAAHSEVALFTFLFCFVVKCVSFCLVFFRSTCCLIGVLIYFFFFIYFVLKTFIFIISFFVKVSCFILRLSKRNIRFVLRLKFLVLAPIKHFCNHIKNILFY